MHESGRKRLLLSPVALICGVIGTLVLLALADYLGLFFPKLSTRMLWIAVGLLVAVVAWESVRSLLRTTHHKLSLKWYLLVTTAAVIPLWMFSVHATTDARKEDAYKQLTNVAARISARTLDGRFGGYKLRADSEVPELTEAIFVYEEDIGCGCCYSPIQSKVTDEDVRPLEWFDGLKTVDLSYSQVTDRGLGALSRSIGLNSLSAAECKNLTSRATERLSQFSSLAKLNLSGTAMTNESLKPLMRLSKLKELNLNGTLVNDHAFAALSQLSSLTSLSVNGTKMTGIGLGSLSRCSKLTSLYASSVSAEAANELNRLKQLTSYYADVGQPSACRNIEFSGSKSVRNIRLQVGQPIDDLAINRLPRLNTLTVGILNCQHSGGVNRYRHPADCDECVQTVKSVRLADLPGLDTLTLGTSDALEVNAVPKLSKVSLLSPRSPQVVRQLGKLPSLTTLNVYGKGTMALEALVHLPKLANLTELSIDGAWVNDRFMEVLPRMPNLIKLELKNSVFSPEGLVHLRELKQLKHLTLDKVTDAEQSRAILSKLGLVKLKVTTWVD